MKKNAKVLVMAVLMGLASLTAFGQVYLSSLADANGNLNDASGKTLLTADNDYIMDMRIYVPDGHELHIEAGTVIKAQSKPTPEEACALVVVRGGKIFAKGSKFDPIIFTHVDDPVDGTFSIENKELWGGVIILGYAQNNILQADDNPEQPGTLLGISDGIGYIEGLPYPDPRHHYGAYDTTAAGESLFHNDDNSGVLRYVSIRHGGTDIGEANEINGLTLGSVGNGTTIDHIEVVSNGDDGIEFFGGTVDVKYINIMFCEDDYLDYDQGWIGKVQFMFGVQLPQTIVQNTGQPNDTIKYGDNGMEIDGDDGDNYPAGHDSAASCGVYQRPFRSSPKVYNATIIGNGSDEGLELKERVEGFIGNSVFANFANGVQFEQDGDETCEGGVEYPGVMEVKYNLFVNCANCLHSSSTGTQIDAFYNDSNICVAAGTGIIDDTVEVNITDGVDAFSSKFNVVPAPGTLEFETNLAPYFEDSFFDYAPYKGAFEPGKPSWLEHWTLHDTKGSGKISCPTDVNGDRQTNASDYNEVVGNYGTSCDE